MTTTIWRPRTLADAASKAAEYADGTPEHLYWGGVTLAFLAADNLTFFSDYETLTLSSPEAGLAQPIPFEQAWSMVGALGRSYSKVNQSRLLRACGAVWGYLEATADMDDVDECAMCGRRIFPLTDEGITECSSHGWVHEGDCQQTLCGDERPEPEWDADRYYAEKYGD